MLSCYSVRCSITVNIVQHNYLLSDDSSEEQISYNGPEQISEYIWIPHNLPNKYKNILDATFLRNEYPNIFVLRKWHEYKYK